MGTHDRLNQIRTTLRQEQLDSILVSSSNNRRYLSGFTGSAGYLVITESDAILATDFRYIEQAGQQAPDFTVHRTGGAADWLPKLSSHLGVQRMGFEAQDMTVAVHAAFVKANREADVRTRLRLVKTYNLIDRLRAKKYPEELQLLQHAVTIADQAMDEVAPTIEQGMTEKLIASHLEMAMRKRGAENVSFDTIVGAGPNGALPHHRADHTVIERNQAIVIDMGCIYEGYCSDLTRTFIVGSPDDKFKRVYGKVLEAQLAAEERIETGMTGQDVDAIARDIIKASGHGDDFGHSLGHGVGLAVHEFPHVGPRAEDVIENGMVLTIEPGIYLSGWGGVRIEDMVVMENGKAHVMSQAKKLSF